MTISVRVKPNVKHQESVLLKNDVYMVTTKTAAIEGKANDATQKILAKYFNVPKTCVRLIRGATARHKTYEIDL